MSQEINCLRGKFTHLKFDARTHFIEKHKHLLYVIDVLSGDFEKMTMSTRYTKANCHFTEDNIKSNVR